MVNKQYTLIVLPTFLFSWNALADNLDGFYIKASYFDAFFNTIGPLEGKEDLDNNTTGGVFSFNKNERIGASYNPTYVPGLAGGIAVGCIYWRMSKFSLKVCILKLTYIVEIIQIKTRQNT